MNVILICDLSSRG